MKKKLIMMGMIILLIFVNTITVYANTETTVTLRADNTEVTAGSTFTVTLSATCPDGINAITNAIYNYDEEKLEFKGGNVVDSTNWSSAGDASINEIFVYSNSTETITSADIYTLTFRVKDDVAVGDTTTVTITEIELDSDAATNSSHTIEDQAISITVIDEPGTEGDGTEGDGTEGDGTEGDGTEGDGTEGDGTEGDGTEGDGTEGDGTEGDGTEGDGTEGDGTEGDGTEGDGTEGDGTEGDGTESDESEGDKTEDDKKDESVANKDYNNAGRNTILSILVAIVVVASIMYRKNQKYKDIK